MTYKIIIDPGHGGDDPGAEGHGMLEKDVVLEVAQFLRSALTSLGYQVVLTREDDCTLKMAERLSIIHANCGYAVAFLSIHCNSYHTSAPNGYEFFVTHLDYGREDTIMSHLLAAYLDAELRPTQPYRITRRRIVDESRSGHTQLTVLHNPIRAATLFEIGFLSNEVDAENLSNEGFRRHVAYCLALGLDKFRQEALYYYKRS